MVTFEGEGCGGEFRRMRAVLRNSLTAAISAPIIVIAMPTSTKKLSNRRATAQKRAAAKAEEAAKVLHSLAVTLLSLDAFTPPGRMAPPTPRNWWRLQAGRFKDDPTFPDFVAQVQAARKCES